jgi:CYTH domain-containing protein
VCDRTSKARWQAMSDYISKSALIEEMRKGQEVIKDRLDDITVSGIYETIEAVIEEIDRQPTLDETEIIRKAFERVVERLEERRNYHGCIYESDYFDGLDEAIEIVKEECGINE